ncbi:ATPase, partial [Streptomyces sp. NPDC059627]
MQDAPSSPLVVGIDVGGTKTQLRALAGADRVADHVRPSSGWRPHDAAAAAPRLSAHGPDARPAGRSPAA